MNTAPNDEILPTYTEVGMDANDPEIPQDVPPQDVPQHTYPTPTYNESVPMTTTQPAVVMASNQMDLDRHVSQDGFTTTNQSYYPSSRSSSDCCDSWYVMDVLFILK